MLPSLIITFRETLEAALIIGIILVYLSRTNQKQYNKTVYWGIFAGIFFSIIGAIVFTLAYGGFEGRVEAVFEGLTMLFGAALLTTMIIWMMQKKNKLKEIESKVATYVDQAHKIGLFSLVFVSILREGIETVIFLKAASFVSPENNIIGAVLGMNHWVSHIGGHGMYLSRWIKCVKTGHRD